LDYPEEAKNVEGCIYTSDKLLLTILEAFGLPKNYMKGEGHFKNWEKQQEEKAKVQRGRAQTQKQPKKIAKKQVGAAKLAQKVELKEEKPT